MAELMDGRRPVAELAVVAEAAGNRFASKTRLNEAFPRCESDSTAGDVAQQVLALWQEIESMALEVYCTRALGGDGLSDGNRVHASLEIFRVVKC